MTVPVLARNVPSVITAPIIERHRNAVFGPYAMDIRPYTRLIPTEDCHQIIALLNQPTGAIGIDAATEIADWMLKLFPREQRVLDQDTYFRGIVAVFAEFPEHLCKAAVDHITKHRNTYPTRAELYEVLSALWSEHVRVIEVARTHLAEHARRSNRKEPSRGDDRRSMSPAERAAFVAKLKAEYPDAFPRASRH